MKESTQVSDPFLCSDCQQLGYCRKYVKNSSKYSTTQSLRDYSNKPPSFSERDISNWVPIRAASIYTGISFRKRLQDAHDLFHEEEFEQASYMYQDMLASREDCDELIIGLAASLFFLGKYEEAAGVITRLHGLLHHSKPDQFSELCAIKIANERLAAQESPAESDLWQSEKAKPSILIA